MSSKGRPLRQQQMGRCAALEEEEEVEGSSTEATLKEDTEANLLRFQKQLQLVN